MAAIKSAGTSKLPGAGANQVHQIFAEKPAVKRAYQANVPTRMMTGQAFWGKYLKHQLLQQACPPRIRIRAHSHARTRDPRQFRQQNRQYPPVSLVTGRAPAI